VSTFSLVWNIFLKIQIDLPELNNKMCDMEKTQIEQEQIKDDKKKD
jgi:hypothetical protein